MRILQKFSVSTAQNAVSCSATKGVGKNIPAKSLKQDKFFKLLGKFPQLRKKLAPPCL
jgi:hypothetical protein